MNLIRAAFGSLSLNLAKWIYTTIEDPFCCTRMTDATAVQVDARCQLSSLDGRLSLKVSSFSLRNFNSLGIDSKAKPGINSLRFSRISQHLRTKESI